MTFPLGSSHTSFHPSTLSYQGSSFHGQDTLRKLASRQRDREKASSVAPGLGGWDSSHIYQLGGNNADGSYRHGADELNGW
jgi:hypothetical protein